jgi:hypothetical protein
MDSIPAHHKSQNLIPVRGGHAVDRGARRVDRAEPNHPTRMKPVPDRRNAAAGRIIDAR